MKLSTKLSKVKELTKRHDHVVKTGDEFIDQRVEGMRNPFGYVASYYGFFFQLAKMLKPQIVVELGSWQGTSAACFASGNPKGEVITIDHHTDPGDEKNKELTIEAANRYDNLFYVQGWTCDALYQEEKDNHSIKGNNAFDSMLSILGKSKIDLLFIDSWHRYDQALKDWNAYRPLLNDGALVICDDILKGNEGGGIENMTQFWDEVKGDDHFLATNLHSGYPMGFFIWNR